MPATIDAVFEELDARIDRLPLSVILDWMNSNIAQAARLLSDRGVKMIADLIEDYARGPDSARVLVRMNRSERAVRAAQH